jgi:hypothetical protein
VNAYVMHQLASDRSRQLQGEAAQSRLARQVGAGQQGRAARPGKRAPLRTLRRASEGAPGLRRQVALLFGRSSATGAPESR